MLIFLTVMMKRKTNDPIQKEKNDTNRPTVFLDDFPEEDVRHNVKYSNENSGINGSYSNGPIQIASGQGENTSQYLAGA